MAISDLDTAQQAQLIEELATLMGDDSGLITAANLETVATRMFATGQSFDTRSSGTIETLMNDEMPEAVDPQSQWSQMASRAVNGRAAAGDSVFLLEALGRDVYGGNFDLDGTLTDQELAELSIIRNGLENGSTIPQISRDFEVARYEQAQATTAEAQATLDSQQGVLQIQTQMAALGWINESDITGEWTRDQARTLIDNTYSDMRSQEALVGEHGEQGFLDLTRGAFTAGANPNLTLDIAGANRLLGEFTDGQDFSQIISEAITSGDPDQIRMAQGLTGQRITGEWDEASLNAAIEQLEVGAITEFPPSMYGQANQLMWGELTEAFEAGTLPLPEGVDPQAFALELMEPSAQAEYFEFVASQHDHAAVIAQAQAMQLAIIQEPIRENAAVLLNETEAEVAVADLGLNELEAANFEMGELSLAALSQNIVEYPERIMTRFDMTGDESLEGIDPESVSFRQIMETEIMGTRWYDQLYGSEYTVGDRTVVDIVLEDGVSIEEAALRAGIDPDASIDLYDHLQLAKMTEAVIYATHGQNFPEGSEPFTADQLLDASYLALEGEARPQPEIVPEEAQIAAATYGFEPGQVDYSFSRALDSRGTGIPANPNVTGSILAAKFTPSASGETSEAPPVAPTEEVRLAQAGGMRFGVQ